MSGIFRLLIGLLRVLTFPLRVLGRLFGLGVRRSATTARKAAGSAAAMDSQASFREDVPAATASFPFRVIERPKLSETSASELSLEAAEAFVSRAHRFYNQGFDLFPSGSLFYEEVEMEELAHALAADDPNSNDSRFVLWMNRFRRTLNDNARRLLLIYSPLMFAVLMAIAIGVMTRWPNFGGLPFFGDRLVPSAYVVMPALTFAGLLLLLLLYQWPYKVVSQRNLLGLDNYITSRFSRINQNFQVAKRFALNVERNKRMSQADELKYEAGVWTTAYNWFAMRLFLCERIVRNQMYQVRRNATLYGLGGVVLNLLIVAAAFFSWMLILPPSENTIDAYAVYGVCSVFYVFIAFGLIVGSCASEAQRVLSNNEWFRFGAVELDQTIRDHVGEDKLQIVTFRDRNRME